VLTVANAYSGTSQTVTVGRGATVPLSVDLSGSYGWYDLTVTSNRSADFVRRLAGHVETGAVGSSDPGILAD
jgi:phospholipase C